MNVNILLSIGLDIIIRKFFLCIENLIHRAVRFRVLDLDH
jgi:hypothetical protein